MNSQQLQEARRTLWHLDDKPLTTGEDAQTWLNAIGVCLWLPRGAQFAAPMPSFVEACAGTGNATPSREAIVHATDLLARLTESGAAIPLNLLGTHIGVEGEHPDFIVSSSALSYVYALRGARPWKSAPPTGGAGRVSTLSLHVWEALQTKETMQLSELRESLGHDISDAGVLRALAELWSSLRVFPIPQGDARPARWQLLSRRFTKQLNAGSSMGQAAALSALISLYLDSVIAASSEEIEAALSPLVARSKVTEVVRALEGNRQIQFTAVGGALLLHFSDVEDHLPPVTEIVLPPSLAVPGPTAPSGPKKYVPRAPRAGQPERKATSARPFNADRPSRPSVPHRAESSSDRGTRKSFGDRGQYRRAEGRGSRETGKPFPGAPRERPPFKPRPEGERRTFDQPRSASPHERAPFKPRGDAPPRKSFGGPRGSSSSDRRSGPPPRERAPFKPRSEGEEGRTFNRPRAGSGERAPFKPRGADGPQRKPFGAPRPGTGGPPRPRPSFGDSARRSPFGAPKRFGAARPPREGGDRKPFSREGRPSSSRARSEGGKSFGPRKSFGARPGGFSKPGDKFRDKPSGKFGAPRPPRAESSDRAPRDTTERRPWKNRPTAGGGSPRAAREAAGPRARPYGAKKASYGKSSGQPFSARPRSSGPRDASRAQSDSQSGGFGKQPGGGFKKSSGPRKPGGFGKGPGGPKRGGFGKRPGGGRPR